MQIAFLRAIAKVTPPGRQVGDELQIGLAPDAYSMCRQRRRIVHPIVQSRIHATEKISQRTTVLSAAVVAHEATAVGPQGKLARIRCKL